MQYLWNRWRVVALTLPALAFPTLAAQAVTVGPYHEFDPHPKIVALTPGLQGLQLANVLDRLEASGLEIPVAVAGAGLVVRDGPDVRQALENEPAVSRILRSAVPEEARGRLAVDPVTNGLLDWWNRGFRPQVLAEGARQPADVDICAGARRLPEPGPERNDCQDNSNLHVIQYAPGRTVCSLVFTHGHSPWSQSEMDHTVGELIRALNWWSLNSAGRHSSVIVVQGAGFSPQTYFGLDNDETYVSDTLDRLGYPGDCGALQANAMNLAMRNLHHADWAFTQVVLNATNFGGAPGVLAFAYLGGPYTVALKNNGSLGADQLDRVMAHEFGHIYWALDEYSGCGGAPCNRSSGYLGFENRNCVDCGMPEGRCVMMSGSAFSAEEAAQMETRIRPCRFTKGQASIWDTDGDGVFDVMDTSPEIEIYTSVPDTLESTLGFAISGRTWDEPVETSHFANPITINKIFNAEFTPSGRPWRRGHALDGSFDSQEEEFEVRLTEMGGGNQYVEIRGRNSVGNHSSEERIEFFVYDVKLLDDVFVFTDRGMMVVEWQVDGEDLGSEFLVYRGLDNGPEEFLASVAPRPGRGNIHRYIDETVEPGFRYRYRLEADIPGKGRKSLGQGSEVAVLPPNPDNAILTSAPNPSSGSVLFTVTIPRGPQKSKPDYADLPDEIDGGGGNILGSPPAGTSGVSFGPGDDLVGGGIEAPPLWRDITLAVYDVSGRLVRDLGTRRELETTRFNIRWDGTSDVGRPAATGIYFMKVSVGGYAQESHKIVLLR